MKKLFILTDYKNHLGSKWNAVPYRSGLDKRYLAELFKSKGYLAEFIPMRLVDFNSSQWRGNPVVYASLEEYGLYYKSYIEDVVWGLQNVGARLMPHPDFLKANNNKVYMEILRKIKLPEILQTIDAKVFGSFNELCASLNADEITFPCVIKTSAGAMSRGVFLAKNEKELLHKAKKISKSANIYIQAKEYLRKAKHKGYKPESAYQHKFIVQPFIPNLENDWKILLYGDKIFVLKRVIRQHDFRASGSGYNYKSGRNADFPVEMLDFVYQFYLNLNVPSLSVDFAFDGEKGYVFEFQAIHFGTSTHYKSKDYYEYNGEGWILKENDMDQEQVFVYSVVNYLNQGGE